MLQKIEAHVLDLKIKPDAFLVHGDTNSALEGLLIASKLHIPVIHVEAGLRSFNRNMAEEINRILTDHFSSLLFCSSKEGVNQLKKEGFKQGLFNLWDVMYDVISTFREVAIRRF